MNSAPAASKSFQRRPFDEDVSQKMHAQSYHMKSSPTGSGSVHGEGTIKDEGRVTIQSLKKRKISLPTKSHSHSCFLDSIDYESIISENLLSVFKGDAILHERSPSISSSPPSGWNSPCPLPPLINGDHTEEICEKTSGSVGDKNREGEKEDSVEDEGKEALQKENQENRSKCTKRRVTEEHYVVKQSPKIVFNNNDVVCDRGAAITEDLVGNRRFCVLLDLYHETYAKATATVEKFGIAQKIRNVIREARPPGRVIRLDKTTGGFSVLKNDFAIKIIERALARNIKRSPYHSRESLPDFEHLE